MGNNNTQKRIISDEKRLTVAMADLIISEGLSFSLSQKPRFKKVLDLAITVSKSKDILDVIHDQNMKKSLSLIKKSLIFLDCYF